MKNSLELIELSSINKVSLVQVSSCGNTGSIRNDPYRTSREKISDFLVGKFDSPVSVKAKRENMYGVQLEARSSHVPK